MPDRGVPEVPMATPQAAFRPDDDELPAEVRRLVDAYRSRCLWFLQEDYYPATHDEILTVLRHIERHGDREGFQRAAVLRRWLSRPSSATSAGS
jgi:hypothetical protein